MRRSHVSLRRRFYADAIPSADSFSVHAVWKVQLRPQRATNHKHSRQSFAVVVSDLEDSDWFPSGKAYPDFTIQCVYAPTSLIARGEPFRWDEERRAHLRAELDAYYARLYQRLVQASRCGVGLSVAEHFTRRGLVEQRGSVGRRGRQSQFARL